MTPIVIIFIVLFALLLLVAIIGVLAMESGGSKTILLPGLGIIVGTPVLLTLLIALEAIVLLCAAFLWRLSS